MNSLENSELAGHSRIASLWPIQDQSGNVAVIRSSIIWRTNTFPKNETGIQSQSKN